MDSANKYPWKVTTPDGSLCSEHKTEAAAQKAARRLQGMGTRPSGYFRVTKVGA